MFGFVLFCVCSDFVTMLALLFGGLGGLGVCGFLGLVVLVTGFWDWVAGDVWSLGCGVWVF